MENIMVKVSKDGYRVNIRDLGSITDAEATELRKRAKLYSQYMQNEPSAPDAIPLRELLSFNG